MTASEELGLFRKSIHKIEAPLFKASTKVEKRYDYIWKKKNKKLKENQ